MRVIGTEEPFLVGEGAFVQCNRLGPPGLTWG